MVVYGKGIVWFTFMTVEYKLRCSVLRQDSPHFCVSPNYTSVLCVCVCVFISSVGFDLVCLRLDFKELKSSHSWSVHFVYKKLPHKVSNCQGPPKVIFWGGRKNICECVLYV